MLQVKIKASTVRNLTDARYFAAREVEWIGFPLQPGSEDAISPETAKSIIEWIDGVKMVGEFDFASAEEILEIHRHLWFDAVQVGMFTSPDELKKLSELTVIKEVVIEKSTSEGELQALLTADASLCDYYLLNLEKAGITWESLKQEVPFSLDFLKKKIALHKVILAMDFNAGNLHETIRFLQPFGISLTGGIEEKVGLKSFDELDEILDQLELTT